MRPFHLHQRNFFVYLQLTLCYIRNAVTKCESSSAGRASPCQGEGREFESRLSLSTLPRFCEAYCLAYQLILFFVETKHPQTVAL